MYTDDSYVGLLALWWFDIGLTQRGWVTHICVSKPGPHMVQKMASSTPRHYVDQHCLIINWTFRNKFQQNFDKIQQFSFERIDLKILMSAKWQPFCHGMSQYVNIWPIDSLSSQYGTDTVCVLPEQMFPYKHCVCYIEYLPAQILAVMDRYIIQRYIIQMG